MGLCNEKVVVKIELNGGYLKSFISGLAKSPTNGESVFTTLDKCNALILESSSNELKNTLSKLKNNGLSYKMETV